ncbi:MULTISPECIES: ABC transporter substrate-binding protein [Nocardioides]|uniref:Extracellular solute-binding protein n=1 Tax=Nocardioides kribbensis TaxID=305517 RepID=A0ABV1P0R6_9ACTN|nr:MULTISPECIES: extracellular solute-binding protein [unclassified Nocardioides]
MSRFGRSGRRRTSLLAVLALGASLGLAACSDEGGDAPAPQPEPTGQASQVPQVDLTFGAWGAPEEISAYQQAVRQFNQVSDASRVELRSWPTREAFVAALRRGTDVPDVYLASRRDLTWLREQGWTRPVDELLDERDVSFGDVYSRDAQEAFSADLKLQCMPYGVSPMVIYYNEDLVDLDTMAERGISVPPESHSRFTFDQFRAAAEFAAKPRRGTRGVYIDPTLRGLSPFVYAGGGEVFDDEDQPTSLDFSSDDTREALETTLEVLRDPRLTLSQDQLDQASGLEWFKRGKVGMIAGFRDLVPELREVDGLDFDVLPMPTLDTTATIGDLTGLCLDPDTESLVESADFLVHMISSPEVAVVTRAGHLVPANQEVALSEDFLQTDEQPASAGVFTYTNRFMVLPPLLDTYSELQAAVDPTIGELVSAPGVLPLDELTTQIDEESREVLEQPVEDDSEEE